MSGVRRFCKSELAFLLLIKVADDLNPTNLVFLDIWKRKKSKLLHSIFSKWESSFPSLNENCKTVLTLSIIFRYMGKEKFKLPRSIAKVHI
jgi:hypothetical protein